MQTTTTLTECESKLREAMQILLSVCDGAVTDDQVGFSGTDARPARVLNGQPFWSVNELRVVYKMIRKYRVQLSGHGFDFDSVPKPEGGELVEQAKLGKAKKPAPKKVLAMGVVMRETEKAFQLHLIYPGAGVHQEWMPKSQMTIKRDLTMDVPGRPGETSRLIIADVPKWLGKTKNLGQVKLNTLRLFLKQYKPGK